MKHIVIGATGSAALVVAATLFASSGATTAQATPASGFSGVTVAKGTFAPFFSHVNVPGTWNELMMMRGASDLYVQNNTWGPGGTTGWHTHPGPSLIIVTEGAVTTYDAEGSQCVKHVYTAGTADNTLVDPGDGHQHVIRNETSSEAKTMAVQLVPAGAPRREDVVPAPAVCPGVS